MIEFACEAIWSWAFVCWKTFFFLLIYLFLAVLGPRFLCEGPLQLWQVGASLHRGARAPHHCGLSRCGAQAPDTQAQQPWPTGPIAPRHAGSPHTRARTRVPRTGRQTPNHCATREAPVGRLLITVSVSVLVIGLFIFFISSWFSLRRVCFSKNLSISSRLSILLAYSCL